MGGVLCGESQQDFIVNEELEVNLATPKGGKWVRCRVNALDQEGAKAAVVIEDTKLAREYDLVGKELSADFQKIRKPLFKLDLSQSDPVETPAPNLKVGDYAEIELIDCEDEGEWLRCKIIEVDLTQEVATVYVLTSPMARKHNLDEEKLSNIEFAHLRTTVQTLEHNFHVEDPAQVVLIEGDDTGEWLDCIILSVDKSNRQCDIRVLESELASINNLSNVELSEISYEHLRISDSA